MYHTATAYLCALMAILLTGSFTKINSKGSSNPSPTQGLRFFSYFLINIGASGACLHRFKILAASTTYVTRAKANGSARYPFCYRPLNNAFSVAATPSRVTAYSITGNLNYCDWQDISFRDDLPTTLRGKDAWIFRHFFTLTKYQIN